MFCNSVILSIEVAFSCLNGQLSDLHPQLFTQTHLTVFHRVELKVNKMTSKKTLLPIEYYRLPVCKPKKPKLSNENLGELLSGDRIEDSVYVIKMLEEFYCEPICTSLAGKSGRRGSNKLAKAIRMEYHANWIVDNLPSASMSEDLQVVKTTMSQGFPIGFVDKEQAYVNNHVNINLHYHKVEEGSYRIVKFLVEPFSIKHEFEDAGEDLNVDDEIKITNPIASCMDGSTLHTTWDMIERRGEPQPASGRVLYTYDVIWHESNVTFADRWNDYLSIKIDNPNRSHWVSIVNSLVIVFVLSAMIAAILVRNLRRDMNRYNRVAMDEEARAEELEEYGWKLVHADVFRPPPMPMFLSAACGTGAQLLLMALVVIFFAALGFMNPAHRGKLLTVEIVLFFIFGSVNGYVTARMYKTFKGKSWQQATTFTAVAFPGLCFALFMVLNCIAWANESSDRVPFYALLILMFLWFGVSIPLVFAGAYFGYKQDAIEFPVNTSSIPRQIPDQPWFMGVPFTLGIGGILPFGSCFVELYLILNSVWNEWYYFVFGFLFLVVLILIITCAEITILFTYFQLCSEDYHWWWRSFCNAGATAIYVFLYSFIYFKSLEANTFTTYILYFGYMGLVSAGLFLMTGCVGMLSSLWFNKVIFASIKID